MSVAVIIVAAGRGTRLGAEIPKQYLSLGPGTPISMAIEAFLRVDEVCWVIPVIHPTDESICATALAGLDDPRLLTAVHGGATRAMSVRRGLEKLEAHGPEHVLIHDAARPFVSDTIIRSVITALDKCDGAFAALPVVDALWQSEEFIARNPVQRDGLWRAQTPQGFWFDRILEAHVTHDGSGADDVAVAREAGLEVRLVMGSEHNYKITTPADLERARSDTERLLSGLGALHA